MSRKSFDPKECIGGLNTIKRAIQMIGKPVTKEYLINSLKNCGLPTNATFWTVFRSSGIIQEVSKGKFLFCSKEPIYWERLATVKKKYQELLKKYNDKKSFKEIVSDTEEVSNKLSNNHETIEVIPSVESAIKLLKEKGYQIFAPIGVLYKML